MQYNQTPRMFKYTQGNAVLTVGIDSNGRMFSSLEKDGVLYAKDLYERIPTEPDMIKRGWTRKYE